MAQKLTPRFRFGDRVRILTGEAAGRTGVTSDPYDVMLAGIYEYAVTLDTEGEHATVYERESNLVLLDNDAPAGSASDAAGRGVVG